MPQIGHTYALCVMSLILLFSIIHLAVALGIIIPFRKYGDIFQQSVGLSAYNLVIAIFGIVTGGLGILATFKTSKPFIRTLCAVSAVLGGFTLISLVTAIILNAKSMGFGSTHFLNNMMQYNNSVDAQNNVDNLQQKYDCCGADMWLSWANVRLLLPLQDETTTTGTTVSSTTTDNHVATVTGGVRYVLAHVKRDITHVSNNVNRQQSRLSIDSSRKKRQTSSAYGDIDGLPTSFTIVIPGSCCTTESVIVGNIVDGWFCLSNMKGSPNHFYTKGCAKKIDTDAGNQLMGIAIINSFLAALAFIAIPILIDDLATLA